MGLCGYQDIGGTWGPAAEEPVNRARVPVKKRGVIRCWGGGSPGATRFVLTRGPRPHRPRGPRCYLCGRRRPARGSALPAGSGAHTMRRFQTWLRSRAGGREPGREGRKEPVGPRLRLPAPHGPGGHASGEGQLAGGGRRRAPGERRHRWALGLQEAQFGGGL